MSWKNLNCCFQISTEREVICLEKFRSWKMSGKDLIFRTWKRILLHKYQLVRGASQMPSAMRADGSYDGINSYEKTRPHFNGDLLYRAAYRHALPTCFTPPHPFPSMSRSCCPIFKEDISKLFQPLNLPQFKFTVLQEGRSQSAEDVSLSDLRRTNDKNASRAQLT